MPLPAATEPFYPKGGGLGTLLTGLEKVPRMTILQQCFVLYNEAVEDALSASHAIRRFLGMNLAGESVPDATTLLKFRRRLEDNKLTASRHLGAHHT
ncbi:MAG: transposase, partial [Betaproteobacteria bacterium]|nr:transposase [Betaproteobacteria bacterium]